MRKLVVVITMVLGAIFLEGCGGGSNKSGGGGTTPPPPPPPPSFEPSAFVGFISVFAAEPAVAFEVTNDHPITVTRQLDAEGDEKLYFHFENQEGEDIDGAENMGVDSATFPVVYLEDQAIVCIQNPAGDYFAHSNNIIGDLSAGGVSFQYCGTDVIQADEISENWLPTYMETIDGLQVVSTFVEDGDGITVGNLSVTTDLEGDVRIYISNPFTAFEEALVDVERGIICSNFILTAGTGAFMTRVTGTDEVSTEGLDQYLGDDLVRDKVIFLSDCNYDLAEWQE